MKSHDNDVIDPSVMVVITEATPSQRDALAEATEAMAENDVKQRLTAEVVDSQGWVSIKVEPLEDYHDAGELGMDTLRVTVGKRKGVKHGSVSTPFDTDDFGGGKQWNGVGSVLYDIRHMM